jgi:hypothetical protein
VKRAALPFAAALGGGVVSLRRLKFVRERLARFLSQADNSRSASYHVANLKEENLRKGMLAAKSRSVESLFPTLISSIISTAFGHIAKLTKRLLSQVTVRSERSTCCSSLGFLPIRSTGTFVQNRKEPQ